MTDGRRGTWALIGSCTAIFWPGALVFGFTGVMGATWASAFTVGRGAIGLTMFFILAAVGSSMFFIGRWQVRLGPKLMMGIGALVCGAATALVSVAPGLWAVYVWAFLIGGGTSMVYMPGMTIVQQWFPARRGLVTGLVSLVFGLSAAVTAPLMGLMLTHFGYRATAVTLATMTVAVGLMAAQWTSTPDSPIDTGPADEAPTPGESLSVAQSVRTGSFWFLWVTWALMGAAGIAMVTLSTAYGHHKWHSLRAAVILLTAFNLTSGLSRIVMGYLSDLIGRRLSMSLSFFAAGLAYLALGHVEGLTQAAILAAVIGIAFGTLFAVSAPLASDCFGLTHFGAIFGLVFTAYGFMSGVLGPALSGYLLDVTKHDFKLVFAYLAAFSLASGVLIWFVRRPIRQVR